MTSSNWTTLLAITGILTFLWAVLRPFGKSILNLIETWRAMVPGFNKLTNEVAEIKVLLSQSAEWERVNNLPFRVTKLEGRMKRVEVELKIETP
jgi:hypothetical protein